MAFVKHSKSARKTPVYYLVVDFRNQKPYSNYYKGIGAPENGIRKSPSGSKRVVIIRAKVLSKRKMNQNHEESFFYSLPRSFWRLANVRVFEIEKRCPPVSRPKAESERLFFRCIILLDVA
ncbi:hypothetical protein CDAR_474111 [Caerostris darwini]|uniref:Uncharacterized protein n=1 Tax=Caerostris darwini TaxID=1538125 RepID=A0AAV4SJG1_9ARAC|nr:hypothetical protein CDAR_474111 [Caerostris darwini]